MHVDTHMQVHKPQATDLVSVIHVLLHLGCTPWLGSQHGSSDSGQISPTWLSVHATLWTLILQPLTPLPIINLSGITLHYKP